MSGETGIKIGEVWSILANETIGSLTLHSDPNGKVEGEIFGDRIEGFWDEGSRKLTFIRVPKLPQPDKYQVFTGYKFAWKDKAGVNVQCLAGSFEAFSGTGGTTDRNVLGWYAIDNGSTVLPGVSPELRLLQDFENNFQKLNEDVYTVLANGYAGTLALPQKVDGSVDDGHIFEQKITGFTNLSSGRTSFIRIPSQNSPGNYQVFTGYRIQINKADSLGQWGVKGWTGSYVAFQGTGASAKRTTYGWYALNRFHYPE